MHRLWNPTPYDDRVREVLNSWVFTPYALFGETKGHAVDCIRFLALTLDELFGTPRMPDIRLPPDTAMHNPRKARRVMRTFLRAYEPHRELNLLMEPFEAGDILVAAISEGSGPGHAILVTPDVGVFQEATPQGIFRTSALESMKRVIGGYRLLNKEEWAR